jgi:putative Holliday junction resolvase
VRCLGLDFGEKTIGIAVSDPNGKIAVGLTTLRRAEPNTLRPSLRQLKEIIREYGVSAVVLGNPLHMDGSASERSAGSLAFKEKLGRYCKGLTITLWDERLSTRAVTRAYGGTNPERVDEMAAVYILQGFLDYMNQKNTEECMDNKLDWINEDDKEIVMYDEEGNEARFQVLSAKEDGGETYLLAEEVIDDADEAEVLHFKCVASDDDEMVFEIVDEEHEDIEKVIQLFKDDYETLEIEIE